MSYGTKWKADVKSRTEAGSFTGNFYRTWTEEFLDSVVKNAREFSSTAAGLDAGGPAENQHPPGN